MSTDIRTIVDPQPTTPALHGLVQSAIPAEDRLVSGAGPEYQPLADATLDQLKRTDPEAYDRITRRWEIGGFTITPENCVEAYTWDPDCLQWPELEQDGPGTGKAFSDSPENETSYNVAPFVIESGFKCDARGFQVIDYAGRARRQLEGSTSKQMEYELWTGTQKPNDPRLDVGATVLGGGAAFTAKQALALISQAMSNCGPGSQGMIHAPTIIVDEWLYDNANAIKERGNRLATVNRGDIIVSGAGYPGTGPEGLPVSPGQAWIYGTSPVYYRLAPVRIIPETLSEALNRTNNDIEYRAVRQAAIGFDPCCHFAVLVQTQFSAEVTS